MDRSTGSVNSLKTFVFRSHTYVKQLWLGKKVVCDENNLFNLTYICKKYGRPDLSYYKRNNYWIEFEKVAIEKIGLTSKYEIRDCVNIPEEYRWIAGSYYPEEYVGMIFMQIDKTFLMSVTQDLIKANKENSILNQNHQRLQIQYENSNAGRRHDKPGSIVLKKYSDDRYGIIYKYVNIAENNPRYKNDIVISNVYNISDMKSLIQFYINYTDLPFISKNDDSTFHIHDIEKLKKFIIDVQQHQYKINYNVDYIIKHYLSTNPKRDVKFFGNMFEYFCSMKFDIPIYKYSRAESISLPKLDKGVDLMHVERKEIGQCKLYKDTKLEMNRIDTFMDFCECEDFKDWKKTLYVNSNAQLSRKIIDESVFEIEWVDDEEFDEFLHKYEIDVKEKPKIEMKRTCTTSSSEIAAEIKRILDEKLIVYMEELEKHIMKKFNYVLTSGKLKQLCDGYYFYNGRDNLLSYHGKDIVIKKSTRYQEYIEEKIGYGAYEKSVFIQQMQDDLHIMFEDEWFTRNFGDLFERERCKYKRRKIGDVLVEVLILKKEDRLEKYKEFFIKFPSASCEQFNEYFHQYESIHGNFYKIRNACLNNTSFNLSTTTYNRTTKAKIDDVIRIKIHDYVENLLNEETAIYLDELIPLIQRDVYSECSAQIFKLICSDITYKSDGKASYPIVDGRKLIRRIITNDEYETFIIENFGYAEIVKSKFEEIMIENFKLYEMSKKGVTDMFKYMLEKKGDRYYTRRTKEGQTLTFLIDGRSESYKRFFAKNPNATMKEFNKHFHRFETDGTYKIHIKTYMINE